MEKLSSLFGTRPAVPFMQWFVVDRDGVTERRIGPPREKTAQQAASKPDGAFYIGEQIRLDVLPPFPGYFQLWNLGSSGNPPKRLFENRWIDGEFTTPTLIVSEDSKTTAETGLNEIVVGIITRQPIEIAPEQMGASRSSISTRGFQSVEEVKRVVLSDLPESDWAWCMLETEVKR